MKNSIPSANNNVIVKKSKIHGRGVFAVRNFKKGERVFVIKGKVKKLHVKNEKMAVFGQHWIGIGKETWISPTKFGRYLNHSSRPSCGIKGKVSVHAMRNIKKDEEITIDYSTTEEQKLWWMVDNTKNKKVVKSIQFLSKKKFKSYLPYIPSYFQKVYLKHHKK